MLHQGLYLVCKVSYALQIHEIQLHGLDLALREPRIGHLLGMRGKHTASVLELALSAAFNTVAALLPFSWLRDVRRTRQPAPTRALAVS